MERLLYALERRFSRYAIEGLTYYLVAAMALTFVLFYVKPEAVEWLVLDPVLVHRGQVWRLFTFLLIPPANGPIWVLFALYWLYAMGSALESEWGAFRYQLYWFVGALATGIGAFAFGVPATNGSLLMALFLAFATIFPDYEILLFFVIPVKVKYLAVLDAVLLVSQMAMYDGAAKIIPILAIANYLLFFGGILLGRLRHEAGFARRAGERHQFRSAAKAPREERLVRRCAACGTTNTDDPTVEFRVCACEKHDGKATDFCLAHARNH